MQGRTTGSSSTGGWLVEEGAGAWAESDRSNITSGHLLSLTAVAALLPFRPSSERLGSAQGASNPCSRNRACPVLLSMKREKLRAASDAGRSTVKP